MLKIGKFVIVAVLGGCALLTNVDGLTGGSLSDAGVAETSSMEAGEPDVVAARDDAGDACTPEPRDDRYLNDVVAITSGEQLSCAVRLDGSLACWGTNDLGQLGARAVDGGLPLHSARPLVVKGLPKVVQVAAGYAHVCALDVNKSVWCWGLGSKGQLGAGDDGIADGGSVLQTVKPPSRVVDNLGIPISDVTGLAAGLYHTCAIVGGGAVACWGNNDQSQLGPGATKVNVGHAILVPKVGGAVAIAAGYSHTCVLQGAGKRQISCWGWGKLGQLGIPVPPDAGATWGSPDPVLLPLLAAGARDPVAFSCGSRTTCVVDSDGNVFATGENNAGQLGSLSVGTQLNAPSPVQGLSDGRTTTISCREAHTCVQRTDGTVMCMGRNGNGELGRGEVSAPKPVPAPVIGAEGTDAAVLQNVVGVSAGGFTAGHACAIVKPRCAVAGTVVCWGENTYGQVGSGVQGFAALPTRVLAPE